MRHRTTYTLAAIVLVAGVIRFVSLDTIPPGLYFDEAIMGVEGLDAFETGRWKWFYPANNGREGLIVNLAGIATLLFGASAFAVRFWPALTGTITIAGVFFFSRALLLWRGPENGPRDEIVSRARARRADRIGLLAAFLMATSFWHIGLSRVGLPAAFVPCIMLWGLSLLISAWSGAGTAAPTGCRLRALAGGALFGVGLHTYAAFRFAPFVALLLIVIECARRSGRPRAIRRSVEITAIWFASAVLTALPMLLYFMRHPHAFVERASQVSVFSSPEPLRILVDSAIKTLLMLHVRGDPNWRHNIAGSPEIHPLVGLCWLVGVWHFARRRGPERDSPAAGIVLLAWHVLLLAPSALTWEGTPHAMRAIGAVPAVMIMAALGADEIGARLRTRKAYASAFAGVVILAGFHDVGRYFGPWAGNPVTASAFARPYVEVAKFVRALPAGTPRFVLANAPGVPVDHHNPDGSTRKLPMPAQTVIYLNLTREPVYYLVPDEVDHYPFPRGAVIVPLERDERVRAALLRRYSDLRELRNEWFTAFGR